MIKRLCSIFLTIALVSTAANAGLRTLDATPALGPFTLPGGTAVVETYSLQYTNDTAGPQTVFGFELLDYTLSVTPYTGSVGVPTLSSNIVDVASTSWTEFGGGLAPLGSIGWSSPFGLPLVAGGATTIGTFDISIPAGFLGEFILKSTDPLGVTVTTDAGSETGQGISIATSMTTVGTAVPEPSSFLFLGLVSTGALGLRFFRRRREDEAE